jgi:hypothetical protein
VRIVKSPTGNIVIAGELRQAGNLVGDHISWYPNDAVTAENAEIAGKTLGGATCHRD